MTRNTSPQTDYNMDETSLSTVQDGQKKIIGARGKRRIGAIVSSERGESATAVVCHVKNLEAIEMAREAGIRMISLPPHTTHRLQPLDVAFFGPLGTYYDEAARTWMRQHPGRAVTSWQVAELFGSAYCKAASVGTAVSGFRASGLWPLDIGVFSDCDFAASAVTDVCSISESGVSDQVGAEVVVPTPLNTADSQTVDDGDVNQVAAVPVGDAQFHAAGVSANVVSEPASVDVNQAADCDFAASAVTDV